MSYRNDRAKILEERDRKIKEKFSDEINQGDFSYDDDIIEYDTFFILLLELKHHIITKDLEVSNDLFKNLAAMINISCNNDEKAYFSRTPQTLAGYSEYYNTYMRKILASFPDLEKDIQEAIEENAKRYSKYLKPDVEQPVTKINIEIPHDEDVSINIDIRKELRLPNPSKETYKKRKDNTPEYGRALKYEQKLFRVYLDGLINSMGRKYPEILTNTRYKTFDDEKAPEYNAGKGRKDYLTTRDGLFLMIDRVSQKSPSERQYMTYNAQDLYLNCGFKKTYKMSVLSTFLAEADCENILYDMVIESVRPLIEYEWAVSVDATGFSTSLRNDYNFNKHGDGAVMQEGRTVKEIDWVNLQAISFQTSNLVIIPRIYYKYSSSEQKGLLPMVKEALREGFKIERMCADKAYSGKEYREELDRLGIDYYCEFPSNVNPPALNDESVWAKQFRFQKEHPEEFSKLYHARSTVESVFGAIKQRVGEKITSKTMSGYMKEAYCKVIVYNLFGMIHQLFINGIVPEYIDVEEVIKVVKSY